MRSTLKKILHPILKPFAHFYLRKVRTYSSRGLHLQIQPSVFHPGMYLSTNIFAEFALQLNLKDCVVLELGAGSGFISLLLAREGAQVTASDINPIALATLRANAAANGLNVQVVESNLFTSFSPDDFDCILINPPYYPQSAKNFTEAAFFCGVEFDYFHSLFTQLKDGLHRADCTIYMILSEDCALETIHGIAQKYGFHWERVRAVRKRREWNYIYLIQRGTDGQNRE
ncbi:MAG: hypothetical protein A3D92_09120 [Bacteroidetes bacterium RIFCSPHIGHO2_02_FULL_44_7]|nr:MAG: hypothetical protein A3D92_09120 [Bacteroidetes bacterium RIFCSPHIGHO2_02_FULL_44_7]